MRMIQNALSGAIAAQAALNTVSQNLSNEMTPGYSRQGVLLSTLVPGAGDRLGAGMGVDVTAIRRFSDSYKNLQMWQAAAGQGELAAAQPYFAQLEQVMGSDGTSLSGGLDKFYSALNAASVEPSSVPLRQQVISEADALARRFNNLNGVFATQQASLNEQRSATLAQINTITQSIAALNGKVAEADAVGTNASGLLDERDRQIDALAALVDVRVSQQPDGSLSVTLRGGQPLVIGNTAATLAAQGNVNGTQTMTLQFAKERFTLPNDNLGGQLGGLNQYQSAVLQPMTDAVRTLAGELATRTNAQLASGFDLNGQAGAALFVFDAASTSGMLQVSAIQADQLGFSSDPAKPANSDNLLALIAIKDQSIAMTGLGNVTISDAYAQLTGHLAIDSQQNKAGLETASVVRGEAEKNWKSTSGVNSDEEAINLVEFQKMYQANMKVIAVANQLFDSTLAIF
ncbi:flagellar hook-associated protein FlgK [Pseudogulbenkiania ferrooxidans]|uniref:Flagellar hook-associated protein 1 n=1 Tax=Pseudogulbenkiania ferrooxidans 2002 TaxID=279714 RepID=B9Z4V4_9NEIS|nr:flagellar hook-associated protein FlgK [Pseudogulbenkiania ferrooxidans]EEG08186.1 flagellar hook-associated protein FlgK [Pseudogulbenkiania ferrooxidans 2002]